MIFHFDSLRDKLPSLPRAWLRILVYLFMLGSTCIATYLLMDDQLRDQSVGRIQKLVLRPRAARQEFAPRVASILLVKSFYVPDLEVMREHLAKFFAGSMALLGGLYWLMNRRGAAFLLLGTFLALFYCTTPETKDIWYPWDMPALVLSAFALVLALREKIALLAVVSALAVAFKETLLLSALYIYFMPRFQLKTRLRWLAGSLLAGVLIRIWAEGFYGKHVRHSDFLHVNGNSAKEFRIVNNLKDLFSLETNDVIWVNAGLLLLVCFLPAGRGVLRGARFVALAFFGGIFFLGKVSEFRIFLEILPVSLLLAEQLFRDETPELPA